MLLKFIHDYTKNKCSIVPFFNRKRASTNKSTHFTYLFILTVNYKSSEKYQICILEGLCCYSHLKARVMSLAINKLKMCRHNPCINNTLKSFLH